MKNKLAAIGLVAAVSILTGCGSSSVSGGGGTGGGAPAPAASSTRAAAAPQVGTPFTVDMGNGNIAKITIVSAQFVDAVSDNAYAPKPKNGKFLKLDVLWETEKGKTTSNPLYFKAKDADGRNADVALLTDGQLASGDVAAGDKNRGFVAFDVKPGPTTVAITDPLLQTKATLTVAP